MGSKGGIMGMRPEIDARYIRLHCQQKPDGQRGPLDEKETSTLAEFIKSFAINAELGHSLRKIR